MFEKDCATKLKEKQLFKIFPAINQNFLMDIFKDHKWVLDGLTVIFTLMTGSVSQTISCLFFWLNNY